ncbi:hypothetical protein OCE56_24685 [Bacillus cereus]|nr:hypothetical protein [Bacillus cereus]
MLLYDITADIYFHQDSDPGAGPEPYGWIKAHLPESNKDESILVWSQGRENISITHKQVTFQILAPEKIQSLTFFGDVKEWDNNPDDVLAYPNKPVTGREGDSIILKGDRYDSYVKIVYKIDDFRNLTKWHFSDCSVSEHKILKYCDLLKNDVKYLKHLISDKIK